MCLSGLKRNESSDIWGVTGPGRHCAMKRQEDGGRSASLSLLCIPLYFSGLQIKMWKVLQKLLQSQSCSDHLVKLE